MCIHTHTHTFFLENFTKIISKKTYHMTNSTFYPFTAPRFFKLRGTCARCADAELCHSAGGWKTFGEAGQILRASVEVGGLFAYHMIYGVLYGFIHYPFKRRTSAVSSMISMALTWFGVQYTNSMLRKSPSWFEHEHPFWVIWRSNRETRSPIGSPKSLSKSTIWWWSSTFEQDPGPKNFRNRCEFLFLLCRDMIRGDSFACSSFAWTLATGSTCWLAKEWAKTTCHWNSSAWGSRQRLPRS